MSTSELSREELERRLATRTAELTAAQRRIDELLDTKRALADAKLKLQKAREERDGLKRSLEYRFGRKFVLPFRKLTHAFLRRKTSAAVEPHERSRSYHEWFLGQRPNAEQLAAMRHEAAQIESPLITVVMPVYNTPLPMLNQAVESVRAQAYPLWELILVDDASPDPQIGTALQELVKKDTRIKVARLDHNSGISAATNAGLALARGEFVGLLDHDDWIEPDTLFRVALLLRETPETDIVYSDEDKVDETGQFHKPFFKPDWSPDGLLSNNYICHFTVIRNELLQRLGGFRADFDGAQDYDLFLRATEQARKISHIPQVLYHWRTSSHSTSGNAQQKPEAIENGAKAISEALARRGIQGTVEQVGKGARYRVRRKIAESKKITIIIPTRDRLELLKRCVESITARTDYPDYEIVIVDNDSQEAATTQYYESLPHRIVGYPGPFNYSAINNYAVGQTTAPWILFLNNDVEVINADWLTSMAEHIQRPEVGAVGAKLLFPDDTIQHAGVTLALKGTAAHAYCHAPANTLENGGQLQAIRNYSAVTAACMLTRRELFEQVGGFDERNLAVTYNDVDYCLKLGQAGFSIVYTPFAQLYHYESASRGRGRSDPAEGRFLRERWPQVLAHDPFNNANLGRLP